MSNTTRPLADIMRPNTIDEIVGQRALLGENGIVRRMVDNKKLSNLILWGPPGCGKTTIARALANSVDMDFTLNCERHIFNLCQQFMHQRRIVPFSDDVDQKVVVLHTAQESSAVDSRPVKAYKLLFRMMLKELMNIVLALNRKIRSRNQMIVAVSIFGCLFQHIQRTFHHLGSAPDDIVLLSPKQL